MTTLQRSLCAATFVLAVTACTADEDDPASQDGVQPTTAAGLCEAALGDAGSATATTLGEIRGWTQSPLGSQPAKGAFGDASDSDPGAWCWTYSRRLSSVYGVGPDGEAVLFGRLRPNDEERPTGHPMFR